MRIRPMLSAVAVLAVLTTAACSSSDEGSDASGEGGGTDKVQAAAATELEQYTAPPSTLGIDAPLSKPVPAGKRVAVMDCTLGSCVDWADAVIKAGKTLGWDVYRIRTGTTPQTITAAFNQAVRDKPDAVLTMSLSKALFAPQAKQLGEDGVLVVTNEDPAGTGDGVVAAVDSVMAEAGTIQATAVIADKGSKANAVFVSSPEYAVTQSQIDAFKKTYSTLCPSCKVDEFKISAADVANGKSTTNMIGYLRSHPEVNYLALGYDPILGAFPPALKSAGLVGKVSVVGHAPTPQQFKYVEDGTVWKSSVMAPIIEEGWHSVDALARAFVGDPVDVSSKVELGRLLVTKDTIPEGAFDAFVPYIPDYEGQFKKLWLVG